MENCGDLKNNLLQNSSVSIALLLKNWHLTSVFFLLVVVVMSCQLPHTEAKTVGVCNGIPCANGGRLLVSNSVWGNCRCRCPSGFVGPYCQYEAARTDPEDNDELAQQEPQTYMEFMERIEAKLNKIENLIEYLLLKSNKEVFGLARIKA